MTEKERIFKEQSSKDNRIICKLKYNRNTVLAQDKEVNGAYYQHESGDGGL